MAHGYVVLWYHGVMESGKLLREEPSQSRVVEQWGLFWTHLAFHDRRILALLHLLVMAKPVRSFPDYLLLNHWKHEEDMINYVDVCSIESSMHQRHLLLSASISRTPKEEVSIFMHGTLSFPTVQYGSGIDTDVVSCSFTLDFKPKVCGFILDIPDRGADPVRQGAGLRDSSDAGLVM